MNHNQITIRGRIINDYIIQSIDGKSYYIGNIKDFIHLKDEYKFFLLTKINGIFFIIKFL